MRPEGVRSAEHGVKAMIPPAARRKRGNPTWGMPRPIPAAATEFELKVRQLRLTKPTYTSSAKLRAWCEHNKNQRYIPEWLLAEWEITVDAYGYPSRRPEPHT